MDSGGYKMVDSKMLTKAMQEIDAENHRNRNEEKG